MRNATMTLAQVANMKRLQSEKVAVHHTDFCKSYIHVTFVGGSAFDGAMRGMGKPAKADPARRRNVARSPSLNIGAIVLPGVLLIGPSAATQFASETMHAQRLSHLAPGHTARAPPTVPASVLPPFTPGALARRLTATPLVPGCPAAAVRWFLAGRVPPQRPR